MVEGVTGRPIRAAGGILWRPAAGSTNGEAIEVAVIHRPRYDDWSIPKGKLNPGEIEIEGAVREVIEETGYRATIVRPLGEVGYLKDGRPKTVRYWAMRAEGGVFVPGREVDELRWLPAHEAMSLLTLDRDKDLLQTFISGPTSFKTLLLVRHGSAGNRADWDGLDLERPLDDLGREQAEALIWLLTRWDIREIVSAPITRCMQTVEPLGVSVGLSVQTAPLLAENVYPEHRNEAVKWLRTIGTNGSASVLCSQGDVIPDLLTRLSRDDKYELPHPRPCKKGSLWSLTFADSRLYAAEYFPPLSLS